MSSPDAFSNPLALAAFLAGLAILCWVLLRRSFRYFGRRPKQQATVVRASRPGAFEGTSRLSTPPDELARWEVQMHDLARRLSAQLDSKISVLESLVQEADRAAARLEDARRNVVPRPEPGRLADDCRQEIELLSDYGYAPSDIASRVRVDVEEVERVLRRGGRRG